MSETPKDNEKRSNESLGGYAHSDKSYIEVGRIDDESVESLMVAGGEFSEKEVAEFVLKTDATFAIGCVLGVGFACAVLFVLVF